MKAITIALLVPAALALWSGSAVAQVTDPAFNLPDATQHIVLTRTGGVIIAEAVNPEDPANTNLIQTRLAQAAMTGLPELKTLGATVKYTFESTWDGAQIVIRTGDPAALDAIHDLLRFRIRELNTGDSDVVN
jgi:hypothetical protein